MGCFETKVAPKDDEEAVDYGKLEEPGKEPDHVPEVVPLTRKYVLEKNRADIKGKRFNMLWTFDDTNVYHGYILYWFLRKTKRVRQKQGERFPRQFHQWKADAIQTRRMYNVSLHFMSMFELPPEDIELAKEHAWVGQLVEETQKVELDTASWADIADYLDDLDVDVIDDDAYFQLLPEIPWFDYLNSGYSTDGGIVFKYHICPLCEQHYWNYPWFCFRRIKEKEKRNGAVGRLGARPNIDKENEESIRNLMKVFDTDSQDSADSFGSWRLSGIIADDFKNCLNNFVLRLNSPENHAQTNDSPFLLPKGSSLNTFRTWPDSFWHLDVEPWCDDWTNIPVEPEPTSLFTVEDVKMAQSHRAVPWPDDCQDSDMAVDGVVWDCIKSCMFDKDDDWEVMNTMIDRGTAWAVLPLDVIKNNKMTKKQELIWSKRDNSKHFGNEEWMARKRERLLGYFLKKYGKLVIEKFYRINRAGIYQRQGKIFKTVRISLRKHMPNNIDEAQHRVSQYVTIHPGLSYRYTYDVLENSDLKSFAAHASRMEKSWQQFLELCDTWSSGYVQLKTSLEMKIPTAWQKFGSEEAMTRRRDQLIQHFKDHKFVKKVDAYSFRDWGNVIVRDWEAFLVLCTTWTRPP